MQYTLKIDLRSALICANGNSIGNTVDHDVCLDECGVPYIPARCMKGCMRKAADELTACGVLDAATVDALFGVDNRAAHLILDNAYLFGNKSIGKQLIQSGYTYAEISRAFTGVDVKISLRGEEHTQVNGLWYVRSVHQSIGSQNLFFTARVQCDDPLYEHTLQTVCRALRHIGAGTTRGMGVVQCTLIPAPSAPTVLTQQTHSGNTPVCIRYVLRLSDDVILRKHNYTLQTHFDGSTVIGAMSAAYLRLHDKADDTFRALFLQDSTVFSPLYPTYLPDGETDLAAAKVAYPTPQYIVKTKYTADNRRQSELVNAYTQSVAPSRQPAPMDGQYAAITENGYAVVQPQTVTRSHYDRESALGYSQNALMSEQIYGGQIICAPQLADSVLHLLQHADLRIGRSKNTQYGGCEILGIYTADNVTSEISVAAGEDFYVVFQSDFLPCEQTLTLLSADAVRHFIADCLHIDPTPSAAADAVRCAYKTVAGFHNQWQMQKPTKQVITAGSVYAYRAAMPYTLPKTGYLGENNREGYGHFCIIPHRDLPQNVYSATVGTVMNATTAHSLQQHITQQIDRERQEDAITETAYTFFYQNSTACTALTPSFIDRIQLMLQESDSTDDLYARIGTVKDRYRKNEIMRIIQALCDTLQQPYIFEDVRIALSAVFSLTRYTQILNRGRGKA